MPLSAGTKLGLYEIVALIGKGGMGEVYRARDTKLKRDVAMKVLPEAFARDAERMARFQREAEVLASLDHPNIGHIYGIVESNGSHALVLALIEGPTLEDRVVAGPVAIEEALAIARQVAEALEYAHERGVIHRDLKPANIKVNSDGTVKVLDFGLAKVLEDEPPAAASIANSPTLTLGHTKAGLILGTAPYMSPEQAVGRPVDRRSDIFSFGAVLYEMLTGQRAFAGPTTPDVLEAIVKSDADWAKLPAQVSPVIQKLLRRCLVKDRKQRLQAIGEARIALENPVEELAPSVVPALQEPARPRWFWPVAATVFSVATLALGIVAYRHYTEQPPVAERLSMLMPERMGFDSPLALPAVSPDGRRVALVLLDGRQRSLWVRDLDGLNARILPGTEAASYPFWSPDSRSLGFFADAKLKRIDAAGGPVRTVCEVVGGGRGGTWNQDDFIVYGTSTGGLFRVRAEGGTPVALSQLDRIAGENNHRTPWFLPDGKHFLYTSRSLNGSKTRVYVDSIEATPGSHTRREVLAADTNVIYVPSAVPSLGFSEKGYLLFVRDRTLMAQPFDPAILQTTGEAVPVAGQVDFFSDFSQGQFSASRNGTLIYTSGAAAAASSQLTWFDRGGKPIGNVGKPADILGPRISPDGLTVATDTADSGGARDIWLHDLVRGTSSRFTLGPGLNQFPVWSPDGSRIVYYSATVDFYPHVKPTNGIGAGEILNKYALGWVTDWSRDGRYVITNTRNRETRTLGIWVIPQFGDRKPFSYVTTQFQAGSARLSPDGQWLAYVSDESKRSEVYVETFPDHGGKWQISTTGGEWPVWNHDGRELYFIGPDRKLVAVEVKVSGKRFQAGIPKLLFEIPLLTGQTAFGGGTFGVGAPFDVSKDGRFLVQVPVRQDLASVPPTVVLNWQAGLKK